MKSDANQNEDKRPPILYLASHTSHGTFPDPIQNLALGLVFEVMGERRLNRTYSEYEDIAERLPPFNGAASKRPASKSTN